MEIKNPMLRDPNAPMLYQVSMYITHKTSYRGFILLSYFADFKSVVHVLYINHFLRTHTSCFCKVLSRLAFIQISLNVQNLTLSQIKMNSVVFISHFFELIT